MVVSIGAYGFDARVVARIDTRAAYICIKLYKIKKNQQSALNIFYVKQI